MSDAMDLCNLQRVLVREYDYANRHDSFPPVIIMVDSYAVVDAPYTAHEIVADDDPERETVFYRDVYYTDESEFVAAYVDANDDLTITGVERDHLLEGLYERAHTLWREHRKTCLVFWTRPTDIADCTIED